MLRIMVKVILLWVFLVMVFLTRPLQADSIYIDVSSGIPVVSSNSAFYWTSGPFDGLHSSVTQLASGAWGIDIGIVGAFRSWGSGSIGLELTNPKTGVIVDSFGENSVVWNDLYSWTTLHTELYTTNASGQLTGRYIYYNSTRVLSEPLMLGSYQLAVSDFTTEWNTWDIYLKGMDTSPVPEPPTIGLMAIGGILAAFRLKQSV